MVNKVNFPKAGATVTAHTHDANGEHVIFVLSGRFKVFEGGELTDIGPGQHRFFRQGVQHAIKALEDDSSYLNLLGWGIQSVSE
jgi:quercetin dioxygenase-like cupin family protein